MQGKKLLWETLQVARTSRGQFFDLFLSPSSCSMSISRILQRKMTSFKQGNSWAVQLQSALPTLLPSQD
jgi:hypothetical protein